MFQLRLAALLAVGYVAIAGAYIIFSGALVARWATSAAELAVLERYKGIGFVLVTGVLLFAAACWALGHLRRNELEASRARERLLATERQALAGLFVSSLAHDANNMSMVVFGALDELAGHTEVDGEARLALADAREATRKLTQLFQNVRALVRSPTARELLDVAGAVRRDAALLRGHAALRGCSLTVSGPDTLTWPVIGAMLDQAIVNLVVNAAQAKPEKARIVVHLAAGADELTLEVHDDGPGFSAQQRARLFEPLFTTKEGGTGLGLLSVREAARAHGGGVEVLPSPLLGGACVRVRFPRSHEPAPSAT